MTFLFVFVTLIQLVSQFFMSSVKPQIPPECQTKLQKMHGTQNNGHTLIIFVLKIPKLPLTNSFRCQTSRSNLHGIRKIIKLCQTSHTQKHAKTLHFASYETQLINPCMVYLCKLWVLQFDAYVHTSTTFPFPYIGVLVIMRFAVFINFAKCKQLRP